MAENLSLFKNGRSGYFYLQYMDQGVRKQKSTKCRTKNQAMEYLLNFGKEEEIKNTPEPISWKQFRSEYETYYKPSHSWHSFSAVVDGFNWFERVVVCNTLASITVRDAQQFMTHLHNVTSIHTARKYYITMTAAFERAIKWEYLKENIWKKIDKPKPPETDAPFLSLSEFADVCQVISNQDVLDVAVVAFNTGMRRGEIHEIRWSMIDFENKFIKIKNTETFTAKNRKQRILPMNDVCWEVFTRRLKYRKSENDLVFIVKPDHVQHQFKAACKKVFGDDTKIHFHSLRHSFCSNLVRKGVNIKIVQRLAGHSSIAVTDKYTHSIGSDAVWAVKMLDAEGEKKKDDTKNESSEGAREIWWPQI